MITNEKRNCDNCFHSDVCTFKDKAIEAEDKIKEIELPDILSAYVHCRKFSRKYGTGTPRGTKEGTPKKLS